jgi:hypothetical protein
MSWSLDTLRFLGRLEHGLQLCLSVKVEMSTIFEVSLAKGFQGPRLSYLTGAAQQQWFPVRGIFPLS